MTPPPAGEAEPAPQSDMQPGTHEATADAPASRPSAQTPPEPTPQQIKRVHQRYAQLGCEAAQAVHDMGRARQET